MKKTRKPFSSIRNPLFEAKTKSEGSRGCQIFLHTIYQNGGNISNCHNMRTPNCHKIKQMAAKYLYQMVMKDIKIFRSNVPKLEFWFENKQSGNTILNVLKIVVRTIIVRLLCKLHKPEISPCSPFETNFQARSYCCFANRMINNFPNFR
jgi:hypothetical protein